MLEQRVVCSSTLSLSNMELSSYNNYSACPKHTNGLAERNKLELLK